ncbi:hypothetical protein LCGC14_2723600, partial [marine sediment metagenome]
GEQETCGIIVLDSDHGIYSKSEPVLQVK